jgi:HAD superfamily hydrolase (TIGR01459 family)
MIVDLFGVLHDGVAAFGEAIDAIAQLRARGCRICLLSNSPRRSAVVAARLAAMGIGPELYDGLVTSGELVFQDLFHRPLLQPVRQARRYVHYGPDELADLLAGLPLDAVARPEDAQFVLATGSLDDDDGVEILEMALALDLPMICANPDREVMIGTDRIVCAGSVAFEYQHMGGRVVFYGKPYPTAYQQALSRLGLPASRVLAIGDSLVTDIAGANRHAMASLLVLSGVHAAQTTRTGRVDEAALEGLCRDCGAWPTFVLPRLHWR